MLMNLRNFGENNITNNHYNNSNQTYNNVLLETIYSLRHRKCGVRGYIDELFVWKPERARYERVRAFHTNKEWI